jgi:hypothetical protein
MLMRRVRCGLGDGSFSAPGFGLTRSSHGSCLDRLAGPNKVWQTTTTANGLASVSGTRSSLSGHIPDPNQVSHLSVNRISHLSSNRVSHLSRDGKASSQWPAREIFGFGPDKGSHGVATSGSKTEDLRDSSKLSPSQPLNLNIYYSEFGITNSWDQRSEATCALRHIRTTEGRMV